MSGFDFPSQTAMTDSEGKPTIAWEYAFSRWHSIVLTAQQSGTTANRPTTGLWIGRQYFDTTLNKPVFVSAVNSTVWRDAAGTVV